MSKPELTDEQKEFIKKHELGFKALWTIYGGFEGLYRSWYFWISLILSSLSIFILLYIKIIDIYPIIVMLKDVILMIFPSILGFNIGAYALIIGFGDKEVLDKIRFSKGEYGYSLFQTIGGTFAISVLIQAFTLGFGVLFHLFIKTFGEANLLNISLETIQVVNYISLFLILFFTIYAVVLVPKIVLNVFSFSQLYHFFSTKK